MGAEVGNPPSGVIPEPAEVAQEAALVERHFRRRTEVKIPIQSCGRIGIGDMANAIRKHVHEIPDAHVTHFAQLAALDDALHFLVVRR